MESDPTHRGQSSEGVRQAREGSGELSNSLHSGQRKGNPGGWGGTHFRIIPIERRESWGIYPPVPTCQRLRAALPQAVTSLALPPAPLNVHGPPDLWAPGFEKALGQSCDWMLSVGRRGNTWAPSRSDYPEGCSFQAFSFINLYYRVQTGC